MLVCWPIISYICLLLYERYSKNISLFII